MAEGAFFQSNDELACTIAGFHERRLLNYRKVGIADSRWKLQSLNFAEGWGVIPLVLEKGTTDADLLVPVSSDHTGSHRAGG